MYYENAVKSIKKQMNLVLKGGGGRIRGIVNYVYIANSTIFF